MAGLRRISAPEALVAAAVANPVAFFFLFRWLTWLMAVVVLYSGAVPGLNRMNEPGLVMYAALQLALGTLYAAALHPRLARAAAVSTPRDLIAAGLADMVGSLAVVYFSGGWGSPFWHMAVTSILVPCFLLPPLLGGVTVAAFAGGYALVIFLSGSLESALVAGQRNTFIGNLVTAFLVAIAINYLGALFRALQAQRAETRRALNETAALFQVSQNVVQSGPDMEDLLTRLTQAVRASGLFATYGILLSDDEGRLRLAASTVGIEELPDELARRAVKERAPVTSASGGGWHAAVPLMAGGQLLGVMVAGRRGQRLDGASLNLVEGVANQVATGIRQASLAREKTELAAQEERSHIAREIHDGIAQSVYMLSLQLETCAELAAQQRPGLKERLDRLVLLSKQTLLEVRHYIFDLKPYLAGEKGVTAMIESQVREFGKVAGISATLETKGSERQVPVPVATCLYRVAQEALANAYKHAGASRVGVSLDFQPGAVRLDIQDDGQGFDAAAVEQGHGLGNMRRRAEELGGAFDLKSAPGLGTRVSISLPC